MSGRGHGRQIAGATGGYEREAAGRGHGRQIAGATAGVKLEKCTKKAVENPVDFVEKRRIRGFSKKGLRFPGNCVIM